MHVSYFFSNIYNAIYRAPCNFNLHLLKCCYNVAIFSNWGLVMAQVEKSNAKRRFPEIMEIGKFESDHLHNFDKDLPRLWLLPNAWRGPGLSSLNNRPVAVGSKESVSTRPRLATFKGQRGAGRAAAKRLPTRHWRKDLATRSCAN